jgi:hypothetical protein
MASTFLVDEVERAAEPWPRAELLDTLTDKIQAKPESFFKFPDNLDPIEVSARFVRNSFVGAVHGAYCRHHPLVLSPDMIWQCVVQGFAIHINKNPEKMPHELMAHGRKKKITVRRDRLMKGFSENDWGGALEVFSEEIRKNVGDEIHSLLTPDFSTTGPLERVSAQAVVMDTFKDCSKYSIVKSCCGIPEMTLEGTVDDWKKLRENTTSLAQFHLQ